MNSTPFNDVTPFDEWNDVVGFFKPNTSYYHEIKSVIEDHEKLAEERGYLKAVKKLSSIKEFKNHSDGHDISIWLESVKSEALKEK